MLMIQLSSQFSVGDADEHGYTHIRLRHYQMLHEQKQVVVACGHGYIQAKNFALGVLIDGVTDRVFVINGDDYDALRASTASAAGQVHADELERALYQWLLDKQHYQGSIV